MDPQIKWILFDFGGCLDSDGMHSRTLFFNQFEKLKLISLENSKIFEEAYTFADQEVLTQSLLINSTLTEMNEIMCKLIANRLNISNEFKIKSVADAITEWQSFYLIRNKTLITELTKKYKLGLVSNFSGNLVKILDDFAIRASFNFILDSYYVGFTKPDIKIFELALKNCEISPEKILFVGDNLERDILPAKKLGMKTALITSHKINSDADYTLASVMELL